MMDRINFHFHTVPDWMWERSNYWNLDKSWKNKYKDRDQHQGLTFLGKWMTGLTDDEGDSIYCKTYNITNNVDTINVAGIGPVYETDIPKTSIKKRIGVDVFVTQAFANYTSSGYQFAQQFIFHNDYSNALIYVSNSASTTTKITIYYTKN